MALVKHPHWYKFLRYSEIGEDNVPTTPFRELIKKMPGSSKSYNTVMTLDPNIIPGFHP